MRDAGLKMVIIGFESGNQRILDFLRKGAAIAQSYEAARICKKLGVKIWANYMLGIPTETKTEVMGTVKMIKKIQPDQPSPAFFTPHPGSDLFDYCQSNKLSLVSTYEDYRRNPTGEKILGVDYKFLNKALSLSLEYGNALQIFSILYRILETTAKLTLARIHPKITRQSAGKYRGKLNTLFFKLRYLLCKIFSIPSWIK